MPPIAQSAMIAKPGRQITDLKTEAGENARVTMLAMTMQVAVNSEMVLRLGEESSNALAVHLAVSPGPDQKRRSRHPERRSLSPLMAEMVRKLTAPELTMNENWAILQLAGESAAWTKEVL